MRKLSYYIAPCAELDIALNIISNRVPCFADWIPLDDFIVVEINCREEDVNFVKDMLAPFV